MVPLIKAIKCGRLYSSTPWIETLDKGPHFAVFVCVFRLLLFFFLFFSGKMKKVDCISNICD